MSPATKLLVKPYFSKPVSCFLKKKNVSICFAYLQNCQSFSPLSQGFRRFICFSDHTVANCNTRGKFSSVEKQYVPHAYLQNCHFFGSPSPLITWLTYFPNLFLGQSPQEKWHLCTKKYLQQANLQFFGSLHHPRSPATHSSFQSVRGYTKAWLTADLASSSPRTSITVFPLTYPHQNPAPDPYIYRDGEGEARPFFMDKIFTVHQFHIPSEPHGCNVVGLLEGEILIW